MKILIVDDEPTILETIERRLVREGFTTFKAESAEDGMRLYKLVKPDLMVLDVMLPNRSGFDLCRAVRKTSNVPVIFLTARAGEEDRVQGLEMGADDYIIKPFSMAELSARVKSVLRRSTGEEPMEPVETDDLKIDPRSHEAHVRNERVALSPKEFDLLYFLSRHRGQVFTRDTLLDRVWGQDRFVSPRTVDVHVRWLREHIEVDPAKPLLIVTVRGVGYKFAG